VRVKLTQGLIEKIEPPKAGREIYWDEAHRGLGFQVTHTGAQTYVVQYRLLGGRSRRMAIGGTHTLKDAIDQWRSITGDVAKGRALRHEKDPLAERQKHAAEKRSKVPANTLQAEAEKFLATHQHLRSIKARKRVFERLVYPEIGRLPIASIRKSDIKQLLDKVTEDSGPSMANMVLAFVRTLLIWHAEQSDEDILVPALSALRRPRERRHRVLSNAELKAVWRTAESIPGPFGAYLRFVLLTATRKLEAAQMQWNEIDGSDWTIPAWRYKASLSSRRDVLIPLSGAARAILDRLPRFDGCPYVFTHDGRRPLSGSTRVKANFDKACGVTGWTIHDLRRTARTLMGKAKVPTDHAERCLGHTIGGIRSVYDKYEYADEKRAGFEALAALVEQIVTEDTPIPA
jgi:integrase